MVLRQPAYRQQVGTLYEMLLRRRRVCKNTQRDIGQQPSLSAFPPTRARVKRARAGGTPTRQTPASRGFSRKCGDTTGSRIGETQREKISGENDAK